VFGRRTGVNFEVEAEIFQKYYCFITKKTNREILDFISGQFWGFLGRSA